MADAKHRLELLEAATAVLEDLRYYVATYGPTTDFQLAALQDRRLKALQAAIAAANLENSDG